MVVFVRCILKVKKNKCCIYYKVIVLFVNFDEIIGDYLCFYCVLFKGYYKGCKIVKAVLVE